MPNQKRETEKYRERVERVERETQIRREPDSASRPALPFKVSNCDWQSSKLTLEKPKKESFFLLQGRRLLKEEEEKNTCLPIYRYLRHWYTHTPYCTQLMVAQTDCYRITITSSIADRTRYSPEVSTTQQKKDSVKIPHIRKATTKRQREAGWHWLAGRQSAGQGATVSFTAV